MLSLAINSTNDLQADHNGLLVLVEHNAQLLQKIRQRLKLFYGEWFLDVRRGVPYFENILGAHDTTMVSAILTHEIQQEPEVKNVINVNTTFDGKTRCFRYQCTIITQENTELNFTNEIL